MELKDIFIILGFVGAMIGITIRFMAALQNGFTKQRKESKDNTDLQRVENQDEHDKLAQIIAFFALSYPQAVLAKLSLPVCFSTNQILYKKIRNVGKVTLCKCIPCNHTIARLSDLMANGNSGHQYP